MIPYQLNPMGLSKNQESIYFTLKALANNSKVSLIQEGTVDISQLYYKTKYLDWTLYSYGNIIDLNKDEYVQFHNYSNKLSTSNNNYVHFSLDGEIEAKGNIQSLLNFSETATDYCFRKLFQNCKALVKAPKVLPAKNTRQYCYGAMFSKTNITNMPDIQATNIENHSCYYMFEECPIEHGLNIKASIIHYYGCGSMFYNCTSLKSFGEIEATTFNSTNQFFEMFSGCTNLIKGPTILPVTTPNRYIYQKMFYNCLKLEKAPILPMAVIYTNAYSEMFYNCSSLKEYQVAFTEWPTNNGTKDWVKNAQNTSDVIFKCPSALDTSIKDDSHVLSNWTIIKY